MGANGLPKTIEALTLEVAAVGGNLKEVKPRLFEIWLPCRVVGGDTKLVRRATVGYYMQESGRFKVNGVGAARKEIAYWGRQSATK